MTSQTQTQSGELAVTEVTQTTLDNSGQVCFNGPMDPNPVKTCGCGCGAEVARRYLPGHDARHKASIVRRANEGTTRQACDRAIDELAELGWTQYASLETLRAYQQRDRGRARAHIDQVTTWLVGPNGQHHARHACRVLTSDARSHGQIHRITRLATQEAITRTDQRPTGWDICQACTTENTLDEQTESWIVGKECWLILCDEMGLGKRGKHQGTPTKRSVIGPVGVKDCDRAYAQPKEPILLMTAEPEVMLDPDLLPTPNPDSRHPQRRWEV